MAKCKYCGQITHSSSQCFSKPAKPPKACKFCTSTHHRSWQCRNKPKPMKMLQTRTKIKQQGPVFTRWMATRRAWFKANKADHYECYLCGRWLTKSNVTLDHIQSRSRHPELRFDLDNLAPACLPCNTSKGSLSLEEIRAKAA